MPSDGMACWCGCDSLSVLLLVGCMSREPNVCSLWLVGSLGAQSRLSWKRVIVPSQTEDMYMVLVSADMARVPAQAESMYIVLIPADPPVS